MHDQLATLRLDLAGGGDALGGGGDVEGFGGRLGGGTATFTATHFASPDGLQSRANRFTTEPAPRLMLLVNLVNPVIALQSDIC